jgi:hypothetical protein
MSNAAPNEIETPHQPKIRLQNERDGCIMHRQRTQRVHASK